MLLIHRKQIRQVDLEMARGTCIYGMLSEMFAIYARGFKDEIEIKIVIYCTTRQFYFPIDISNYSPN